MRSMSELLVRPDTSVRGALDVMTRNQRGVVFVCDRDAHLIGVVSDGDIRRGMLTNTSLEAPVRQVMNTDPVTATSPDEAARLLRANAVIAIPIVSPESTIESILVSDGEGTKLLRAEKTERAPTASGRGLGAAAIIPARGGSKRVERKNLVTLAGRPLIAWAIAAAKEAHHVDHVIVSTDDSEIAEVARTWGAEVPWLRPPELATDTTPSIDVLVHAVAWVHDSAAMPPALGVLLEPTAPLRNASHIDQALELLAESDADSVVSVSELPHILNPEELLVVENGIVRPYPSSRTMDTRRLRGQQPPVYVQNGLVYAFRTDVLLEQRSLYGRKSIPLITGWEYYLDIDTPGDLLGADARMALLHQA